MLFFLSHSIRFMVVFGSCVMASCAIDFNGSSSVSAVSTVNDACQMLVSTPLTSLRIGVVPTGGCASWNAQVCTSVDHCRRRVIEQAEPVFLDCAVQRFVVHELLVRALGRSRTLVGEIRVWHHHRLPQLFKGVAITDRCHLDADLMLAASDVGERDIAREMVEPISATYHVDAVKSYTFGPLTRTGVDRYKVPIVQLGIFHPINCRFDVGGLRDKEAEGLLLRVVGKHIEH